VYKSFGINKDVLFNFVLVFLEFLLLSNPTIGVVCRNKKIKPRS